MLALALLSLAVAVGCQTGPTGGARTRSAGGEAERGAPHAGRSARPAGVEVRSTSAAGDVVEAGQSYVAALFAADDATAAQYLPGYGDKIRQDEAKYEWKPDRTANDLG